MKLKHSDAHLTYCLNVHAGEAWADQVAAIEQFVLPLKKSLSPDAPFGLGLRIGARAARELAVPSALESFRRLLHEHRLYAFTINGFPYGCFHNTAVKQQFTVPTGPPGTRRLHCRLADLLAALLPEDFPEASAPSLWPTAGIPDGLIRDHAAPAQNGTSSACNP
jgi:hypothetical protein